MSRVPPPIPSRNPLPVRSALPLDYFEKQAGPWLPVLYWMARAVLIWAVLVILAGVSQILFYGWQTSSPAASRITMVSAQTLAITLPAIASALAMLLGCILLLTDHRNGGWLILIIGCACMIVCDVFLYGLTLTTIFSSTLGRNSAVYGPYFATYRVVTTTFSTLVHSFMPVMTIALLCKREIREAR